MSAPTKCKSCLWPLCMILATAVLSEALLQRFQFTAGQRLEIYCHKISQSWTKDGKPYSAANNSLAKISNDGGYTKLQISTLKLKDAGIYACSNSRFQVDVYEPRNLTAIRREITVLWSQSAQLSCIFTGEDKRSSSLFVRWYYVEESTKREIQLLSSNRYSIYWHKAQMKGTLIVRNAKPSDAGIYKCVGGPLDNIREAQDAIRLNVTSTEPRIQENLPMILETYEGADVLLTCSATGVPLPSYNWFRQSNEGVTLGRERELQLRNVTKADAGMIVCVATNPNGNVTDRCKLLINGLDDKQVEGMRNNVASQARVFFELKYPHVDRDRADATAFVVANGEWRQSQFPVKFTSNFAVYIMIDSLRYEHAGRYGIIVRHKKNRRILQKSVKRFEIYGPPEAVSNVQLSYQGSFSAIITMPTNTTNRPLDGVRVQLWQYVLGNSPSLAVLSEATIRNRNATLVTLPLALQNPNASLALEISAFGPYGKSEPLLKAVTLKSSKPTALELDFPETALALEYEVENGVSIISCLDNGPYDHFPDFQANRRADSVYVFNFIMNSLVIRPTISALRRNNVLIAEKSAFIIEGGFDLRLNFAKSTLSEAVENYQKFRTTIDGLGLLKAGSCLIKVEYSCIAKYCENQLAPINTTEATLHQTSYISSGITGQAMFLNQDTNSGYSLFFVVGITVAAAVSVALVTVLLICAYFKRLCCIANNCCSGKETNSSQEDLEMQPNATYGIPTRMRPGKEVSKLSLPVAVYEVVKDDYDVLRHPTEQASRSTSAQTATALNYDRLGDADPKSRRKGVYNVLHHPTEHTSRSASAQAPQALNYDHLGETDAEGKSKGFYNVISYSKNETSRSTDASTAQSPEASSCDRLSGTDFCEARTDVNPSQNQGYEIMNRKCKLLSDDSACSETKPSKLTDRDGLRCSTSPARMNNDCNQPNTLPNQGYEIMNRNCTLLSDNSAGSETKPTDRDGLRCSKSPARIQFDGNQPSRNWSTEKTSPTSRSERTNFKTLQSETSTATDLIISDSKTKLKKTLQGVDIQNEEVDEEVDVDDKT